MKKIIDTLSEELQRLEKETRLIEQLDSQIIKRLKVNQRQTTINELETGINVLEFNASQRTTQELFIYAELMKEKIILNAKQTYNFKFLTLQEIELKTMFVLDEGLKQYWNNVNRLTSYIEFRDRAERLLNKIKAKELDDYISYSSSRLIYEILGEKGELLEQIGVDKTNSYTTNRINQIIQQSRDKLSLLKTK
jgi:hypothetical protein